MADRDIRARFASDTAEHTMTVLHDDGLYRHLQFRRQVWRPPLREPEPSSLYWFDLITVPGALIFQGDGESFAFRRVEDMFEFFRGPVGRINPGYWAEKLTDGSDRVMKYDQEICEARVKEAVAETLDQTEDDDPFRAELSKAVREDILESEEIGWEEAARRVLTEFAFYRNDDDRYGRTTRVDGELTYIPAKAPDFQFHDVWEWSLQDYDWWFLWALHGIVWGIAQYDASRQQAQAADGCLAEAVSR